jgi:hypothetical protein
LKKLANIFHLVHFHGNNCCGTTNYKNITVPNVFECTYIKKDLCNIIFPNKISVPNELLDYKNVPSNEEIYLSGYPFNV